MRQKESQTVIKLELDGKPETFDYTRVPLV